MDIFLEYLMRKKTTGLDVFKKIGVICLAVVLCVLIMIGFPLISSFLNAYILLAIAGVLYFAVVFMRNFSLEYEYIFTNGELDIDIVKAQKTRKRMTSLNCRNIEVMASDKNMTFKRDFEDGVFAKKFDAVFDKNQGRIYHIIFSNGSERCLLTFQPPVKLLAAMKKLNPRSVNVDAEDVETEGSAE